MKRQVWDNKANGFAYQTRVGELARPALALHLILVSTRRPIWSSSAFTMPPLIVSHRSSLSEASFQAALDPDHILLMLVKVLLQCLQVQLSPRCTDLSLAVKSQYMT